jgi:hypothetical protein
MNWVVDEETAGVPDEEQNSNYAMYRHVTPGRQTS